MNLRVFMVFLGVLFVGVSSSNADIVSTGYVMTGASSSADGRSGLVPQPTKGANTKFLRGDGQWVVPTDTKPNNATLTVQRNGASVGTFTANASTNATINIDVSQVRTGGSTSNSLANMWIE